MLCKNMSKPSCFEYSLLQLVDLKDNDNDEEAPNFKDLSRFVDIAAVDARVRTEVIGWHFYSSLKY